VGLVKFFGAGTPPLAPPLLLLLRLRPVSVMMPGGGEGRPAPCP
jgi:hypothetical protein